MQCTVDSDFGLKTIFLPGPNHRRAAAHQEAVLAALHPGKVYECKTKSALTTEEGKIRSGNSDADGDGDEGEPGAGGATELPALNCI